jgi:hypothetical protein
MKVERLFPFQFDLLVKLAFAGMEILPPVLDIRIYDDEQEKFTAKP